MVSNGNDVEGGGGRRGRRYTIVRRGVGEENFTGGEEGRGNGKSAGEVHRRWAVAVAVSVCDRWRGEKGEGEGVGATGGWITPRRTCATIEGVAAQKGGAFIYYLEKGTVMQG